MRDELKFNGSGYYDDTAYKAMKNFSKSGDEERKCERGDVFKTLNKTVLVIGIGDSDTASTLELVPYILTSSSKITVTDDTNTTYYSDVMRLSYRSKRNLEEYLFTVSEEEMDSIRTKIDASMWAVSR